MLIIIKKYSACEDILETVKKPSFLLIPWKISAQLPRYIAFTKTFFKTESINQSTSRILK